MGRVIKGSLPGFVVTIIGIGITMIGFATLNPGLAAIGISIGNAGLGMMLSGAIAGAASYFVKKPSMDMGAAQDRLHISVDPTAIGKWILGETTCATDIIYAEQHGAGSNQGNITYVIAAAAHTITSFETLYINEDALTFGANPSWATAPTDWAEAVYRHYRLGAIPEPTAILQGTGTQVSWPATGLGSGMAHFALLFQLAKPPLKNGIPTRMTQVVKGAPVYDPRLDSSQTTLIPPGSGAHRYTDQSTWEYTNGGTDIGTNWALLVVFYLLGWYSDNSRTEKITNGGFDTDTGWTKGTGWTIDVGDSNVATATGGISTDLEQTVNPVDGATYRVTYTITRSAGSIKVSLGGDAFGSEKNTSGTYTEYLTAGSANELIEFRGVSFTGTVDDVSIMPQLVFGDRKRT